MGRKSLIALILHGAEERNLEYKASMNWSGVETRSKVIRAAMSMANIRDGGSIVFGVEENAAGEFLPVGMRPDDAESFNLDNVMDAVNRYADPFVEMELERVFWEDRVFVVLQVKEFAEIPVVCRKSGVELRRGAIYTRSRSKNESVPISSQTEMREVLEMAFEKQMRRYRSQLDKWGMVQLVSEEKMEEKRFDEELARPWDDYSPALSVTGNPVWKFLIRPPEFRRDRLGASRELVRIIEASAVRLRGLSFPELPQEGIRIRDEYIEARSGERGRRWWWRFYRSGQFLAYRGLPPHDREAGRLDTLDALEVFTELYEFASRLVQKEGFDSRLLLHTALDGIEGCGLYYLRQDAPEFAAFTSAGPRFSFDTTQRADELITRGHEEALERTVRLLQHFRWENPPRPLLAEEQRKFLERRLS